jgi:hypothetical protein
MEACGHAVGLNHSTRFIIRQSFQETFIFDLSVPPRAIHKTRAFSTRVLLRPGVTNFSIQPAKKVG